MGRIHSADLVADRHDVAEGNFMAMRRAAFDQPSHSAKLARLMEIVEEAGANGHKIIVFSLFRDVCTLSDMLYARRMDL